MTREEAIEQIKECATCDYDGSDPCNTSRNEVAGLLRMWQNSDTLEGVEHEGVLMSPVKAAIQVIGIDHAVYYYCKELQACHEEEYDLDGDE